MRTFVYVDGFNLYYRALKGTSFKWLDLNRLCQIMLPHNEIARIKYYTARVRSRPEDPNQPVRQEIYLRALRTLPNLEIVFGQFLQNTVTMPLATPQGKRKYAQVIKTEEKGSDVNIATHLVHDGHLNRYDVAVLVTNDSDLVEPVHIVREALGKTVGILNPQTRPGRSLLQAATFLKTIRSGALRHSQFPPTLQDEHGHFHKPMSWK